MSLGSRRSTDIVAERCDNRRSKRVVSSPIYEDHSGGYRIEPVGPGGVLVGFRPGEVRNRVVVWWSW